MDGVSDGETTEIRSGHEIDIGHLSAYLGKPPARLCARRCRSASSAAGQSNPTYLLTTGGHKYVLRKKPAGQLLHGAHMSSGNIA